MTWKIILTIKITFEKPKKGEKSWDKMKKNLNPEDFVFKDKTEGVYIKAPGYISKSTI